MNKTQQDKQSELNEEKVYLQHSEEITPWRKWQKALHGAALTGPLVYLLGSFFSDRRVDQLLEAVEQSQPQTKLSKLASKVENSRGWVTAVSFGSMVVAAVVGWIGGKSEENKANRIAAQALEEKKRGFIQAPPGLASVPMPVVIQVAGQQPTPSASENYPLPIMGAVEPQMQVNVSAETEVSRAQLDASHQSLKS